jgi:hypothetical protein
MREGRCRVVSLETTETEPGREKAEDVVQDRGIEISCQICTSVENDRSPSDKTSCTVGGRVQ